MAVISITVPFLIVYPRHEQRIYLGCPHNEQFRTRSIDVFPKQCGLIYSWLNILEVHYGNRFLSFIRCITICNQSCSASQCYIFFVWLKFRLAKKLLQHNVYKTMHNFTHFEKHNEMIISVSSFRLLAVLLDR